MLSRKNLIQSSAVALTTFATANSLFGQSHSDHKMPTSSAKNKYSKAMMAALHCTLAADICINHCINELAKGDKMLAACLKTASETKAACESFIKLASMESSYTKKMATLCVEICKSCEAECKKHAEHHQTCKDCMESCKACIKEMSVI